MSQPIVALFADMELIPVLDLAAGVAVHARAGRRADYAPVQSVLIPDRAGDALALARAFREKLGARTCYIADLDGIEGRRPQHELIRLLASEAGFGGGLMVDAGVADLGGARGIFVDGAKRVVVGLETLRSFEDLDALASAVGGDRLVFSLDLRMGQPLLHPSAQFEFTKSTPVLPIAGRAVTAGVGSLLVLDLARIGMGRGVDVALLAALKRIHPDVSLLAGGGITGRRDLEQLADLGCNGAIVASAFHAGRLSAADVAELQHHGA